MFCTALTREQWNEHEVDLMNGASPVLCSLTFTTNPMDTVKVS